MKPFSSAYIADGVAPGENVDIVEDIYVPALQNSNIHKRLTFSFSSQGLVELAIGLEKFIKEEALQNRSQYMKRRKKNLPEKAFLPQHPENTYKEYWNGWDEALKNN